MPALAKQTAGVPMMVEESLRAVATPDLAEAILRIGLHYGALDAVPEEPLAARRFVIGPLRRGIEQILGIGAAESVCEHLEDLLVRAAGSGEHPVVRTRSADDAARPEPAADADITARHQAVTVEPRERHDTPTVPAPATDAGPHLTPMPSLPVVVVITRDIHTLDVMVGTLHRSACVFGADSIPVLQRRLRAATRPVVILDARTPTELDALDLYAELPEGSTLVIWGGAPGAPTAARPFIPCDGQAGAEGLAALCQSLISRPF